MKTRHMCLEAVVFLAVVCVVAFTVNAQRRDGLDITRNFFAGSKPAASRPPAPDPAPAGAVEVTPPVEAPEHGFQSVTLEQAYQYYQQADSSILFIDARADAAFEQCRIPTAVQFNHYMPDETIDDVLSYAADAQVIIIYCNGGSCEDSILAAHYLTTEVPTPLDYDKVYVFEGGIQAWIAAGHAREPENCRP